MTHIVHSDATIPTTSAQKYIDQLSKHWAHKCDVTHADGVTHVVFPFADLTMHAHPDHLAIRVSTATTEHLEKSKEIFMTHLGRFAFREGSLSATWQDQTA